MVGRAIPPTPEERYRMSLIGEQNFGCLCCMVTGKPFRLATVQHVTQGFKRLGHMATYGACPWHHLGEPPQGMSQGQATQVFGPSLAHDKRGYVTKFGPESILVELQDQLILEYVDGPWFPFELPDEVRQRAIAYWVTLRNGIN